jgi:hypothetical protein
MSEVSSSDLRSHHVFQSTSVPLLAQRAARTLNFDTCPGEQEASWTIRSRVLVDGMDGCPLQMLVTQHDAARGFSLRMNRDWLSRHVEVKVATTSHFRDAFLGRSSRSRL